MHGCSRGACVVAWGGVRAWDTTRYGDTVNERAVCILLECILVQTISSVFNIPIGTEIMRTILMMILKIYFKFYKIGIKLYHVQLPWLTEIRPEKVVFTVY